jgi:hypothetical protein
VVKDTLVVLQVLLQMVLVVAVAVLLQLVVLVLMDLAPAVVVLDLLVKVGKDINLQ